MILCYEATLFQFRVSLNSRLDSNSDPGGSCQALVGVYESDSKKKVNPIIIPSTIFREGSA